MTKLDIKLLIAIISTSAALGGVSIHYANANHGFEGGAVTGTLPSATTVLLAGQVMRPGDYMPLVDFSPNYVSGHLLVRIPCDSNGVPLVTPVAGHIDESASRTYVEPAQLNIIPHASSLGNTCVYHSHIPAADTNDVGVPGAPRITDIGLLNQGTKNVVFRTSNAMSFTLLRVLGDINPPNQYGPSGTMPAPYNVAPTFPPTGLSNLNTSFDHAH